jgi:hypothetical protein
MHVKQMFAIMDKGKAMIIKKRWLAPCRMPHICYTVAGYYNVTICLRCIYGYNVRYAGGWTGGYSPP